MRFKPVILDSGPLGKLSTPGEHKNADIKRWAALLLAHRVPVLLPDIIDYEIRRNYVLEKLLSSEDALDQLSHDFFFVRLGPNTLKRAATLWAETRRRGRPTGSNEDIDVDVILSALAIEHNAVVATENLRHISQFTEARLWQEISPETLKY